MSSVADDVGDVTPGLRLRKKQRTRSSIIDAAVELCLRQGYDRTTVDQIAAAAEVSTRTFSRYFPTKESVIAGLAADLDALVAQVLETQPLDISEHEALVRAHLELFSPDGAQVPSAFGQMAAYIQIVNSSSTLTTADVVTNLRPVAKFRLATARRMDLPPDHPAVRLVIAIWTSLVESAFSGMGEPGNDPIEAGIFCERLKSTFALFTRTRAPWRTGPSANVEPPAGELPR
jgi:AcrR family transcriptional regulator